MDARSPPSIETSSNSEDTPLLRAPDGHDHRTRIFREELIELIKSGLPIYGSVLRFRTLPDSSLTIKRGRTHLLEYSLLTVEIPTVLEPWAHFVSSGLSHHNRPSKYHCIGCGYSWKPHR
jgi:hypothetical protein